MLSRTVQVAESAQLSLFASGLWMPEPVALGHVLQSATASTMHVQRRLSTTHQMLQFRLATVFDI